MKWDGSALILTVVLTSLLAVVGVMFLFGSRLENAGTRSIADDRQLNYAVESLIAQISHELVLDMPGEPNQEYYDYPDPCNRWLASLEPVEDPNNEGRYLWPQISDINEFFKRKKGNNTSDDKWATRNISIESGKSERDQYSRIELDDANGSLLDTELAANADADGDGVADAKWFILDHVSGCEGEPIYAAVRIVDNAAMLNINTAYKFDMNDVTRPSDPNEKGIDHKLDGSQLWHVNLLGLSYRDETEKDLDEAAERLQRIRCGEKFESDYDTIEEMIAYDANVAWSFGELDHLKNNPYTPFDIADELELRNRFILNNKNIKTRIELGSDGLWPNAFTGGYLDEPVSPRSDERIDSTDKKWFSRVLLPMDDDISDEDRNRYSYRHLVTAYNADQLVDPNGDEMFNVNIETEYRKRRYKGSDRQYIADYKDSYTYYEDSFDEDNSRDMAVDLYERLFKAVLERFEMIQKDQHTQIEKKEEAAEIIRSIAQLAVNVVDFGDEDMDPTWLRIWLDWDWDAGRSASDVVEPESDLDENLRRRFMRYVDSSIDEDDIQKILDANDCDVVYGFDAQPFISELGLDIDMYPESGLNGFALELYNPFKKRIRLYPDSISNSISNGTDNRYGVDHNGILGEYQILLYDYNTPMGDANFGVIGPNSRNNTWLITFEPEDIVDPNTAFVVFTNDSRTANRNYFRGYTQFDETDSSVRVDPDLVFFGGEWIPADRRVPVIDNQRNPNKAKPPIYLGWQFDTILLLRRFVFSPNADPDEDPRERGKWIYVDRQFIPREWAPAGSKSYYERLPDEWHIAIPTMEIPEESRARRFTYSSKRGTLFRRNRIDKDDFKDTYEGRIQLKEHMFSFLLPNPYRPRNPADSRSRIRTVGDIARLLTIGHSTNMDGSIAQKLNEAARKVLRETDRPDRNPEYVRREERKLRLDLQNPYFANIFQYVTAIHPEDHPYDNDPNSTQSGNWQVFGKGYDRPNTGNDPDRVPGRININTANWFVLSQLPYMTPQLARAIVTYRDKLKLDTARVDYEDPCDGRYNAVRNYTLMDTVDFDDLYEQYDFYEKKGFTSIGELNFVIGGDWEYSLQQCALDERNIYDDGADLENFPDITRDDKPGQSQRKGDEIVNDFEERDVLFSRISNLVTVRSDIYTAYILVRLGTDGPQKRMIAILDRSRVQNPTDKVNIIAIHPVQDPR